MKTVTCKQLGGICDAPISAETFEEAAEMAKAHGMQMMADPEHQTVMHKVMSMSQEEMDKMINDAQAIWDTAPEA